MDAPKVLSPVRPGGDMLKRSKFHEQFMKKNEQFAAQQSLNQARADAEQRKKDKLKGKYYGKAPKAVSGDTRYAQVLAQIYKEDPFFKMLISSAQLPHR